MRDTAWRKASILIALVGAMILFPTPAFADVDIGYLLLTAGSQVLMTIYIPATLLLIVVIIEAIIVVKVLRIHIRRAFWVSLAANLVSTALGLIAGVFFLASITAVVFPFIVFLVWWATQLRKIPRWVSLTILCTILGYLIFVPEIVPILPDFDLPIDPLFRMYGFLLPGFGASAFIEGIVAGRLLHRTDIWKAIMIANVLSYIFLVPATAYYASSL